LSITVTDLDISTRLVVERREVEEPGKVALPLSRLVSLLRELPGSGVVFETTGDSRNVTLRAESYEFRLLGEDPEEFPDFKGFSGEASLTLERDKFADMLRRVSVAAGRDANRYQLAGVCVDIEEDLLAMTATDGKRLTHDWMRISAPGTIVVSAIIPNRAVDAMCRILGIASDQLRFALHATDVQIAFDRGEMSAKNIAGKFPEYRGVIPTDVKTRVTARRGDLVQAARSASLVTDRESATILFRFEAGRIFLESKASDIGESRISIPAEVEGEPLQIRFNPAYFIDALRTVPEEEVRMDFCGPSKPAAVRGAQNYRHYLMPLVVGTR
jgi:DNA polymerase-3 subunit beta